MGSQRLLKLAHSRVSKRERPYWVHLTLRLASDPSRALSRLSLEVSGPRVFVVGTATRCELPGPRGMLPRHLAVVTDPAPEGVRVRIISLHPVRGLDHRAIVKDQGPPPFGSVSGIGQTKAFFERFLIEAVTKERDESGYVDESSFGPLPFGEQLAFHDPAFLRPVGNSVSSVVSPSGGGHAIPALVTHSGELPQAVSLVLRHKDGIHRVSPVPHELNRGMLIGRSRGCVLGRGFCENDGLSRIHAMVLKTHKGVYAFDLASRYGLRDVSRPNKLVHSAPIDNGIGCLVYGAGHLLFET